MVLAATMIRIWHILILRRYLDEPSVVAAWIVAAIAVWAFTFRPSRSNVVLICFGGLLLLVFHGTFERAASDGREYFAQVRSIVMDRDLDFANENATLGARGAAKMYPIGTALLWVPFMLLARAWLGILNFFGGSFSLDGYTNPYQRSIGLGTLIYGFAGIVLMQRILRDYFTSAMATGVAIAVATGTFFVWYITVENSMSHGASMFATMLFLYVWHRGRPRTAGVESTMPSARWWILLGAAAGLMTLVRWQNSALAVIAFAVSCWQLRHARGPAVRGALMFAASGAVVFLPQLVFWQIVRGSWHSVPAADHGFSIANLNVLDVLFSPNHGLLSTTPLVYLALIGLPFFVRRDPSLATVLIVGFAAQILINSGSGDWWGGPGFGARRFDNCLLAFGAGLASLLMWLARRPLVAPVAAVGLLLLVNLGLMIDTRSQKLRSSEAITAADALETVSSRVGNPFSFPFNAYVAWRYDADLALYDRLKGRTYSNIDIDLGDAGDDMFLGRGWLPPERNATMNFRWATGPHASVVVPIRAPTNYRLEFVCSPFEASGMGRQTIDVLVNRASVGRLALQPGVAHYQLDVPPGAWRSNLNLVQFVFGYATSPQAAGMSADSRVLAAMFDSLRLHVITGGRP